MPKPTLSSKTRVIKYIREFPNETFKSDGDILYCSSCEKSVSTVQRFQVTQHIATSLHKKNIQIKQKWQQGFISTTASTSSETGKSPFFTDLCSALVKADIPIHKISNPDFKEFLEKYTGKSIPHETTLRKNYLPDIYTETLCGIRKEIGSGPIWVSIDETTDVEGRYVANIIVGKLCHDSFTKPYLLDCQILEKCNHQTIARFFNDSMSILWPNGKPEHEKVFLLLSDAAPYMIKAGTTLKTFYPKMIHFTCAAHAFHRVAETVRAEFPDVDSLISTVKKVFLKAPSRVSVFKETHPELRLPPQPVVTRWGTWLEAADYYSENFEKIKDIISRLDADSAAAIPRVVELMEKHSLKNDLAFISSNCSFLGKTITQLESQNVSMIDNMKHIQAAAKKLEKIPGDVGKKIKKKIKDVLNKNPGWNDMLKLAGILEGTDVDGPLSVELTPVEIATYLNAPVTSVDVERSFSRYKAIYQPNRRSFTFENLKMHILVNCFKD